MTLINEAFLIDYPEDIKRLRKAIPRLEIFTDYEVQSLYRAFSEREYMAGWMILSDDLIEEFNLAL